MKKLLPFFIFLLLSVNANAATWFQCSGDTFCGASTVDYWGTVDLASGQSSPVGSTNVWRWTFPSGMPGGEGVGNVWTGSSVPGGQQEFWIQYYFKYSSNFTYHGVVNKQFYFYPSNTMGMGIIWDQGISMGPQQGSNGGVYWPNQGASIGGDPLWYVNQKGTWHKYKGYFKLNTSGSPSSQNGIYKAWIDDVLVSNYSTINFYNSGSQTISAVNFIVIYGGTGGSVPQTQYQYVAGVYIGSTDPGGSVAGDATAPYLDTFSPANGTTGVSQATTSVSFHFKDSGTGSAGADSTTLTIACTSPSIATKNCGDANFSCTGTSADYTATLSGLSLSYDQVVSCTINGSDLASPVNTMQQQTYSFTVEGNPNPALAVSTTSLPSGTVGTVYNAATLSATGGTSPYTWDTSAGDVPTGLVVPSSGTGSWGVPSEAGTFTATYRATDFASATATKSLSITIVPAPGVVKQNTNFADTYINSGSADTNYGTGTGLYVYQWPAATVANRTIIFDNVDIRNIPSGKNIDSAKLRLYLTGYEGYGGTDPMRVHAYLITGTLPDTTTVTWNTWDGTLTELGVTEVAKTTGWYEWDVTTGVSNAYAAGIPLYVALDGGSDGAQDTSRIFASIDHATTAWRPQLVVNYSDNIALLPPNAPTGHSVSAGDAQVTMHPGTSVNALFYSAWYTSDGTTPSKTNGTLIAGVTDGQTLSSLTNGTTYKFVFTASNASGESIESSVDSATPEAPPGQVPSAPSGHSVTALSASIILYVGTSQGADSFNAYITNDGSTPSKASYWTKITGATNGRIVSGLTNGTEYKVVYTAVNVTGESSESTVVSGTPASASNINFLINMGNALINAVGSQLKNFVQ